MQSKFFNKLSTKEYENAINQISLQLQGLNHFNPKAQQLIIDNGNHLAELITQPRYSHIPYLIKQKINALLRQIEVFNQKIQNGELHYIAEEACPFTFQIPSDLDIARMQSMVAGTDEDQASRLEHMVHKIEQTQLHYPTNPILSTEEAVLPEHWHALFNAIDTGQQTTALRLLENIPPEDPVFKALSAVHSQSYLRKLVISCIQALDSGSKKLNHDVIVTPGTFELVVKDLCTTLNCPSKICLSFGLPTHHANSRTGNGFCIINKVAALMHHALSAPNPPDRVVIAGLDVNRDDGLADIVLSKFLDHTICHIDVFDSRVYPNQDEAAITSTTSQSGELVTEGITCRKTQNQTYYSVDLSQIKRKRSDIHPALLFTLEHITKQINEAKANNETVMIILPAGWDSHEMETAPCGRNIEDKKMTARAAHLCRFDDADLRTFYQVFWTLYQNDNETITGVYWGLEGGYDRQMYEQQIELLVHSVNQQFQPEESYSPTFTIN